MLADRSTAHRIALVHDDDIEAAKLAAMLGERGFCVSHHHSDPTGLSELSASQPDLVVVDADGDRWPYAHAALTPVLDGTPVVVLTGPSRLRPPTPEGVLVLRKPASLHALAAAVERIFSRVPRLAPSRELHRDRLALLGMASAELSHDINNMLVSLLASLYGLAEVTAEDAEGRALVEEALHATDKIRVAVADMQNLSRKDEVGDVAGDVRSALQSALRLAHPQLRSRARVVTRLGPAPSVQARDSRLVQLFLNLLINAGQAFTTKRVADNTLTVVLGETLRGECLVEVSDTGAGIAPEHLPRVFEPFFTTKASSGGTGLGLALCRAIVSSLGGAITVESTLGRGTTFRILLPAAAAEPPNPARPRLTS